MPVHILAFLYPKPDRVARVEEVARTVSEHVYENEPGALQYQWFRTSEDGKPVIVVWETYVDEAAVEAHKNSSKMAWLLETSQKEDFLAAPLRVLPLEQFTGFASRS